MTHIHKRISTGHYAGMIGPHATFVSRALYVYCPPHISRFGKSIFIFVAIKHNYYKSTTGGCFGSVVARMVGTDHFCKVFIVPFKLL